MILQHFLSPNHQMILPRIYVPPFQKCAQHPRLKELPLGVLRSHISRQTTLTALTMSSDTVLWTASVWGSTTMLLHGRNSQSLVLHTVWVAVPVLKYHCTTTLWYHATSFIEPISLLTQDIWHSYCIDTLSRTIMQLHSKRHSSSPQILHHDFKYRH